jgi:hypothetical protein
MSISIDDGDGEGDRPQEHMPQVHALSDAHEDTCVYALEGKNNFVGESCLMYGLFGYG